MGPDYVRPAAPELPAWSAADSPAIRSEAGDFGRWWQVFNDPVLDRLIEKACQENLDLHIAGLRILESRAKLGIAVGGLYPQQQAIRGGWTHTTISKHGANTQPGMDLNYLWRPFRSFSAVVWATLIVVTTCIWTLGISGWFGATVTTMVTLTVLLILAVGIADAVHIISGYLSLRRSDLSHENETSAVLL